MEVTPTIRVWQVTHKDQPKHGGFITDRWDEVEADRNMERLEGEGSDNVVVKELMMPRDEWEALVSSDDEFGGW